MSNNFKIAVGCSPNNVMSNEMSSDLTFFLDYSILTTVPSQVGDNRLVFYLVGINQLVFRKPIEFGGIRTKVG